MIFGPSDADFHVELDGIKKCLHQKWPKQRDSNGRPAVFSPTTIFVLRNSTKNTCTKT